MFQVEVNMAEPYEDPQWEECDDGLFQSFEEAVDHIEWMMNEYGLFEFRIAETL